MFRRSRNVNINNTGGAAASSSSWLGGGKGRTTSPGSMASSSSSPRNGNSFGASDKRHTNNTSSTTSGVSTFTLFVIALVLTVVTRLIPVEKSETVQQKAKELANEAFHAEQELEKEMHDLFRHREQHPPVVVIEDDVESNKWVNGEKELKRQLKVLAQRQSQGLDIGVPVLTRYIEGLPAWPQSTDNGGPMDVDEWKRRVDESYKQTRKAEKEWERKVSAILAAQKK